MRKKNITHVSSHPPVILMLGVLHRKLVTFFMNVRRGRVEEGNSEKMGSVPHLGLRQQN